MTENTQNSAADATAVAAESKKKAGLKFILWWRIDLQELDDQVTHYDTLKFYKTARFIAAALFLLSATITSLFAYFAVAGVDAWAYLDGGIFIVLAGFIWHGHRWAMIAGMLFWTLEKAFALISMPGANGVMQLLWWAIYMQALWLAMRVEFERKKRAAANLPSAS